MNLQEAIAIAGELHSFTVLMQSPNARWESLQSWLARNPRWRQKLNHYVKVSPDAALTDLKAYLCEQTGMTEILLSAIVTPAREQEARSAIEKLQTLYRERVETDKQKRKEIAK
jgi:hypothetical protein